MIKKILGLMMVVVVLSGCSLPLGGNTPLVTEMPEERPVETLTGVVETTGEMIFLVEGVKRTEIVSKKIDLKKYAGQTITVVGEFSGTTLYVDEVK